METILRFYDKHRNLVESRFIIWWPSADHDKPRITGQEWTPKHLSTTLKAFQPGRSR